MSVDLLVIPDALFDAKVIQKVEKFFTMLNAILAFIYRNLIEAPSYHLYLEGCLLIWVIWLIRKKKQSELRKKLTPEEEEQILKAWNPRPLVEENLTEVYQPAHSFGQITGRPGKYIEIDGKKYLNLATHNYLGLVDNKELDNAAETCIRRYGVGSCGPRGFYGTVDVHLELEDKIAEFLNLEETALYSYGFAAIASAIPSYAKAGDIIFTDELVNFAIQRGLQASRSIIVFFKHNDWKDLEQKLEEQNKIDRKNPKKASKTRKFCVVEGIYTKTGDMCPLDKISRLCKKHKVRLFVDESISFGTLGRTGRGITEQLGVPIEDVDFISGSLEHGLASFGGFIVGPSFVVDHQRISGLGYCFSASLPPLLAGTGITALNLVKQNPGFVQELQETCLYFHWVLQTRLSMFFMTCDRLSPIKFLYLEQSHFLPREYTKRLLDDIIGYVKHVHNIALVQPMLLEKKECVTPLPSIRISVNRLLTRAEMDKAVAAIEDACLNLEVFEAVVTSLEDEYARKELVQMKKSFIRSGNQKNFQEAINGFHKHT